MRFLSLIPVLFMVGLLGYGLWDFSVNGFAPAVPVDEYAEENEEITDALRPLQASLQTELSSEVLPRIEDTLALIESEYGASSPETLQAKSEAAIMLSNSKRTDLALPYMESAVEISRELYGDVHRETALVLNDLAMLKIENSSGKVSAEASDILREVITTREQVIGPAHPETVGAKIGISDQLYLLWQQENGAADHPFLVEAGGYLDQVLSVDESTLGDAGVQADLAARVLAARVAHAREDHAKAAGLFAASLPDREKDTDPALFVIFADSYNEYATSLRALERGEEADYMIGFINLALSAPEQLDLYIETDGGKKEIAAPEAAPASATTEPETAPVTAAPEDLPAAETDE